MSTDSKASGPTTHERLARDRFAAICRKPPTRWAIVRAPAPEVWYDFLCPDTGKYGQCRLNADYTWHQEPRGTRPVLLACRKGGRP